MELLLHSIKLDWPVLLPILLCSIATIVVAMDRIAFYKANKRNVIEIGNTTKAYPNKILTSLEYVGGE